MRKATRGKPISKTSSAFSEGTTTSRRNNTNQFACILDNGAAEGTRTPAYSLASCRTTPILRPPKRGTHSNSFITCRLTGRQGQEDTPAQRCNERVERGPPAGRAFLVDFQDARRLHNRRSLLPLGKARSPLAVYIDPRELLAVVIINRHLPVVVFPASVMAETRGALPIFRFGTCFLLLFH